MILASFVGDPGGAVLAAVVAPVAFIILFILLAKDPGPRRNVDEGHPSYTGRRGEEADESG